jgi:methionyl aminopeptidase
VAATRVGRRTGDISAAIQERVERAGFNVARDYVGFAIGAAPHEDPPIPCFGRRGVGPSLVDDELLSIYVIAMAGQPELATHGRWTATTVDGARVVTLSRMIAVRAGAAEVLTADPKR